MAQARPTPSPSSPQRHVHFTLADGAVGGVIGGWVFALGQMITAMVAGEPAWLPWKLSASIVLGVESVRSEWTFGLGLVGAAVHFALSTLYGIMWAGISRGLWPSLRDRLDSHAALAALYGLLLWLLDFQLVARGLFPWFLSFDSFIQVVLHGLAYGMPLGLYVSTRIRASDRVHGGEPRAA